jgi:hypothetical protein
MGRDDQDARTAWEDYRDRQDFEHSLIDHKISWFLTTQGVMFAAYGLTIDKASDVQGISTFRSVVAWVGLILGILTLIGVGAVVNSKMLSFRNYKAYCIQHGFLPPEPHGARKVEWGVRTGNTLLTLLPDIFTPILFTGGWAWLLASIL